MVSSRGGEWSAERPERGSDRVMGRERSATTGDDSRVVAKGW
jgi:hypothetical protein